MFCTLYVGMYRTYVNLQQSLIITRKREVELISGFYLRMQQLPIIAPTVKPQTEYFRGNKMLLSVNWEEKNFKAEYLLKRMGDNKSSFK